LSSRHVSPRLVQLLDLQRCVIDVSYSPFYVLIILLSCADLLLIDEGQGHLGSSHSHQVPADGDDVSKPLTHAPYIICVPIHTYDMTLTSYVCLFSWNFLSPFLPVLVCVASSLFTSPTPSSTQRQGRDVDAAHTAALQALLGVTSSDGNAAADAGGKQNDRRVAKGSTTTSSSISKGSSSSRRSRMQTFTMQSHKQLLNHASVIHGEKLTPTSLQQND
jgi:hypothetical protein